MNLVLEKPALGFQHLEIVKHLDVSVEASPGIN